MKKMIRGIKLLTVTLLLLAGANLIAEDKPPAREMPPPEVSKAWQRRLPELNSDRLPLEEVVRLLRHEFPELNFIVKEKVRAESVAVTLRSVTLEEILKALEPATEGRVHVLWPTNDTDRLIIFDHAQQPRRVDPTTGLPFPAEGKKVCRVFNLSQYLSGLSDNELDAAIAEIRNVLDTAWSMLRNANGESEPIPTLSVHRGTKLLVAVGDPEDLMILQDVIIGLQGSAPVTTLKKSGESNPGARTKSLGTAKPAPSQK